MWNLKLRSGKIEMYLCMYIFIYSLGLLSPRHETVEDRPLDPRPPSRCRVTGSCTIIVPWRTPGEPAPERGRGASQDDLVVCVFFFFFSSFSLVFMARFGSRGGRHGSGDVS